MADIQRSSDDRIRRSTIVKVIQTDNSLNVSSLKSRTGKLCLKEEPLQSQWSTRCPSPTPPPDDSQIDSLTPIVVSTTSTLTKPKRIHPKNENIFCGKQFNSSTFFVSESNPNVFGDTFSRSKRSDTFDKTLREFKDKDKVRETDVLSATRKSRLIFLSQIYLLFHISVTICLIGYKGYETNIESLMSHQMLVTMYLSYLLFVSIIFILMLRCLYIKSDEIGFKGIRSEQLSIVAGAASLGAIQLFQLSLDIAECIQTELVFIPVLEFAFDLFLIHFLLTQVIQDKHLGLRNIVISHLLSTQISLWLMSLDSKPDVCFFNLKPNDNNLTSVQSEDNTRQTLIPKSISFLMIPVLHDYKLLTIFILITIWFTNNQSKINFIRAKLFDEEAISSTFLTTKPSYKGFAIGFVTLFISILIILLEDKLMLKITHILIQIFSTIISIIGLIIIHKKKKYLNYKYKINFLDYHFIVYATLLAGYVYGLTQIIITSPYNDQQLEEILDGMTLIIQISCQSFLIRLQRRKFVHINQVFIISVFSNLSLWIIEIYILSHTLLQFSAHFNSKSLISLFVSLNRFYSCLVFYQFWKTN